MYRTCWIFWHRLHCTSFTWKRSIWWSSPPSWHSRHAYSFAQHGACGAQLSAHPPASSKGPAPPPRRRKQNRLQGGGREGHGPAPTPQPSSWCQATATPIPSYPQGASASPRNLPAPPYLEQAAAAVVLAARPAALARRRHGSRPPRKGWAREIIPSLPTTSSLWQERPQRERDALPASTLRTHPPRGYVLPARETGRKRCCP